MFRIRGKRYVLRESITSMKRHPLVVLASLTTMFLLLFLLAAFALFSFNARHLLTVAGQQPPIEIVFRIGVRPDQVETVVAALEADESVIEHKLYTPQENYDAFKERICKEELFESFSVDRSIPYSINVRLDDPAHGEAFYEAYHAKSGVREVMMESEVMKLLQNVTASVRMVTLVIFVLLTGVTIFIISNMIRIAALSRAQEIMIMKYIGATNQYIRFPFLIEGGFIGLGGALLAALTSWFIYTRVYIALSGNRSGVAEFALLPPSSVMGWVFLLTILIGGIVGIGASWFSVRRYVHV